MLRDFSGHLGMSWKRCCISFPEKAKKKVKPACYEWFSAPALREVLSSGEDLVDPNVLFDSRRAHWIFLMPKKTASLREQKTTVANIRTYIETCARNGVNIFQALLRLTQNNPYSLQKLCTARG